MREASDKAGEFLLAHGGPFFELQKQLRLLKQDALRAGRRSMAAVFLAWGVPALISLWEGNFFGSPGDRTFLVDLSVWARFFIAVGLFILMERPLELRLRDHLRQLVQAPLIGPESVRSAADAVTRALKRRDALSAELICFAGAALLSFLLFGRLSGQTGIIWAHGTDPQNGSFTVAGWWVVLFSNTLFWFLFMRWIWRIFVWARLVKELASMDLRLVATHPDGLGGIAFLGEYPNAFTLFVLAVSCVPASIIAQELIDGTMTTTTYGYVMAAWLVLVLVYLSWPLMALREPLTRLRKDTILACSAQATRHKRALERDVLGENIAAADSDENVTANETADADKMFAAAKKMSTLAITRQMLIPVSLAALAPLVLAGATQLPLKELMQIVKKLVLF